MNVILSIQLFSIAFQGTFKVSGIKYDSSSNPLMFPDGNYKIKVRYFDDIDDNIYSLDVGSELVRGGELDF